LRKKLNSVVIGSESDGIVAQIIRSPPAEGVAQKRTYIVVDDINEIISLLIRSPRCPTESLQIGRKGRMAVFRKYPLYNGKGLAGDFEVSICAEIIVLLLVICHRRRPSCLDLVFLLEHNEYTISIGHA
jgi:hypothetical protein